jgi:hypothetical protein
MSCLIYYYNRVTFSRSPDYTKMFTFGSTWGDAGAVVFP